MRAYREETPVRQQRSGPYAVLIGALILVIAALTYFALRDTAEPPSELPLASSSEAQPADVIPAQTRSAVELPVAANAPAVPIATAEAAVAPTNFGARALAPPRATVGVGTAPTYQRENSETFVINGELLEELEAKAPPVIQ